MTVSSQLKGGEQETLCAHIQGASEPVALSVALETEAGSSLVLEEDVQQDFYRCLDFQVRLQNPPLNSGLCVFCCHTHTLPNTHSP